MPNSLPATLFGAVLLAAASTAFAQDKAASGAQGANTAMCAGCHGIPGYKTAYPQVYHVPKIGGQNAAYIVAALKAYRSGERSHPSMRGIAASLTDKDMEALAAHYADGAGAGK